MNAARWIWAGTGVVVVLGALAAGVGLGGGPTSRDGWEAAGWIAGVLAALALAVAAVRWAMRPTGESAPAAAERRDAGSGGVSNTVTGEVSGTVIQAGDVHGDITATSYGGDHVDFRGGTFHGPVTGKRTHQPPPEDD